MDKGFDGMMVGYAEDSGAGVYRMYNLKTGKISCTRDIKWLNKSYGEYLKSEKEEESDDSSESSVGLSSAS